MVKSPALSSVRNVSIRSGVQQQERGRDTRTLDQQFDGLNAPSSWQHTLL